MDRPQEQLRAITLPADPVPVYYPSVENFDAAETNYRKTSIPPVLDPITGLNTAKGAFRVTMDCQNRVTEPIGRPEGMDPNAVMPFDDATMRKYGVQLPILSVIADGTNTVVVTCYAVHNLQPENQVSLTGLAYSGADGFYSVDVTTATQFKYYTYNPIPAGSLFTSQARAINLNIGLPRGFKRIPKIFGPPQPPYSNNTCFFLLEDGSGFITLENGGFLTLEQCGGVPVCYFELEDGTGVIQLENGSFVTLEQCSG